MTYEKLSKAQIEAIKAVLEQYKTDPEVEVTDSAVEAWTVWATGAPVHELIEQARRWNEARNNPTEYTKAIELLKLFHPEMNTALWKALQEDV